MRTVISFLLVSFCLAACSDVPVTNPYDPAAPSDQQAQARLVAELVTPAGYAPEIFAEATAELRRLSEPTKVAASVPVERSNGTEAGVQTGKLLFARMAAGLYLLEIRVPGLAAAPLTVELPIGGEVDLGLIALSSATGAVITGTATRADRSEGEHAGIVVSATGTPYSTVTSDTGAFTMQVGPGLYRLKASFPGYASATPDPFEVQAGQTFALPTPLVLAGLPGAVRGRVTLPPEYDSAERRRAATVRLVPEDGSVAAPNGNPDDSGAFELAPVPAGRYTLEVSLESFVSASRVVEVGVEQRVDVGLVRLDAALFGTITGTAQLAGALSHGGIQVSARDSEGAALTSDDGGFRLTVLAGTRELVFAFPGYGAETLSGVEVAANAVTALAEPVVLAGSPGRVRGRLRFPPPHDTAANRGAARVTLTSKSAGPGAAADHSASPDADGAFVLDGVGAGTWLLDAALEGFAAAAPRTVEVSVGESVDVGDVLLFPALFGRVSGVARLTGAADHGGIRVEAPQAGAVTFTDRDGAFALDVIVGLRALSFSFPGYGGQSSPEVLVLPNEVTPLPAEIVLVGLPGSVEGSVSLPPEVRATDLLQTVVARLVRGADDVEVQRPPVSADGGYLLDDVPAGRYHLTFELPGYAVARVIVPVEHDRRTFVPPVLLQPLPADVVLHGVARLLAAAEHAGIRVELAEQPQATETNAQGLFALPMTAVGGEVAGTLLLHREGYADAQLAFRQPVPEDRVVQLAQVAELVGEPGRIRGVVLLDDRVAPDEMRDVRVTLSRLEGDTLEEVAVGSPTLDGVFVFDGLGAGTHYVVAELEGLISGPQRAELAVGEHRDLDPVVLSLDQQSQGATLFGVARLEGRAPGQHGGIRVEDTVRGFTTQTNADGQFELSVVAGTYDLRFAFEGFANDRVGPIEVAPQGRAGLPRNASLSSEPGRVRGTIALPAELDDVAILTSVELSVVRIGDEVEVAAGNPDANGDFLFGAVPPGEYTVTAARPGLRARRLPIEVLPGATVDLHQVSLILEPVPEIPNPVIRGTARLAGRPDDQQGGILVEVPLTGFVTVTQSDGSFQLEVIPGQFRVRFSHDRYQSAEIGPLSLEGGDVHVEASPITLLGELGRVRGTVRLPVDFAAERMALVTVNLTRGGRPEGTLSPQLDGTFIFPAIAAGVVHVEASSPGLVEFGRDVELGVGETSDAGVFQLGLPASPTASVSGTARLQGVADPAGHGGIRVEVVGTPFTAVTAGDGRFVLATLPGLQTLAFRHDGYGTQTVAQLVLAGEEPTPLPAQVILPAQPGTVRGSITLTRFGTAQRVQAATAEVLDAQGARVAQVQPSADGRFTIPNLSSGAFTVRVSATGYERVSRAVDIPVGDVVEAGDFALVHKSQSPSAVAFAGRVLLGGGGSDHTGTLVRLRITNPDLAFDQALTDGDGRFELNAAPDETYRASGHRNGFLDPDLDTTWRYDAADRRFEDDDGQPFDATLQRAPLNGRVEVPVRISPDWIPQEQQFVGVRLSGAGFDQLQPQVNEANAAVFNNVPAGEYTLLVERSGFRSVQMALLVDHDHPALVLNPISITLVSLAAAQIDLSGRDLAACALRQAPVSFVGANLTGVRLTGDFSASGGAACAGCVICGAFDFGGVDLINADLTGATSLAGVRFVGGDLFGAELAGRNLRGANLTATNLFGADATGATLSGAILRSANLGSARLTGARFSDVAELQAMVNAGSPPCPGGAVRPRPAVDLTDASFNGADLTGAILAGVNLRGAVLQGTSLRDVHFERACLSQAVLTLNDLSGAFVDGADLTGAQLPGAVLTSTSLRGTQLQQATLTGAIVESADFRPKPLANGQACNPYPFAAYDVTCVGDARFNDVRCCRTELDGANLNGASLVGASLDGVDLVGASLLGATVGEGGDRPLSQPVDCRPELFNDCVDACAALQTCHPGTDKSPDDCSIWVDDCLRGQFLVGDIVRRMDLDSETNEARCTVNVRAALGCPGLQADGMDHCNRGQLVVPQRVPPCTWSRIDQPPANGACAPEDIPTECVTRATTFSGARLDRTQLTALTLARAHLNGAQVRDASARGAAIFGAYLQGADFTGTDFGQSDLTAVGFAEVNVTDVDFTQANLQRASFDGAVLTGTSFLRADLTRADLARTTSVDRPGQDALVFRQAVLRNTDFTEANLPAAIFRDTVLENVTFDHTSLVGADFTKTTIPLNDRFSCSDLSGADFSEAELDEGSFFASVAENALFIESSLAGRSILASDLDGAKFLRADLSGLQVSSGCVRDASPLVREYCDPVADAEIECTSMRNTYFESVNFDNARVSADLEGAVFRYSNFVERVAGGLSRARLPRTGWFSSGVEGLSPRPETRYPASDSDLTGACFVAAEFVNVDLSRSVFREIKVGTADAPCNAACLLIGGGADNSCNLARNRCTASTAFCLTFDRAVLLDAVFDDADLRHTLILDSYLTNVPFRGVDLSGSTFKHACGQGADFISNGPRRTDLTGTQFYVVDGQTEWRTDLQGSTFVGATMTNANLRKAWLPDAVFDGVNGTGLNLREAHVAGAVFQNGTNLTGADLRACNLNSASFNGVNFTNATMCQGAFNSLSVGNACPGCNFTGVVRDPCAGQACGDADPCP